MKKELIKKYLEDWGGLRKASIEHYAKTGKVSGSLFMALNKMMEEYATHELQQSLRFLRDLTDIQNGAPLETHRNEWEEVMAQIYKFLNKFDK